MLLYIISQHAEKSRGIIKENLIAKKFFDPLILFMDVREYGHRRALPLFFCREMLYTKDKITGVSGTVTNGWIGHMEGAGFCDDEEEFGCIYF